LRKSVVIVISFLLVFTLIVEIFSFLNEKAEADTPVSGHISTNTTWTLANSPYWVEGDIIVDNGATLTIEPGVEVKFNGYYGLYVDGNLTAVGTENDKIKFTSNSSTPQYSDWSGIYIRSGGHCDIECSEIKYADDGIKISGSSHNKIENCNLQFNSDSIFLDGGCNATVSNCNISNTGCGIILYYSSNNKISNCNISSTTDRGLFLASSLNNSVTNCSISKSDDYGINLWNSSDNNIERCKITSSSPGVHLEDSTNNTLTYNQMWYNGKASNLKVDGDKKQHFNHRINTSNTINGIPLYYYFDLHDEVIKNLNTTHLTLACCTNISLESCNVTNGDWIILQKSSRIRIERCYMSNNSYSIRFEDSSNNTIIDCNASLSRYSNIFLRSSNHNNVVNCKMNSSGYHGICVDASSNNTVRNCDIFLNPQDGIFFGVLSSNNSVINCNISNNRRGIINYQSSNNSILQCNISNNYVAGVLFDSCSGNNIVHNNSILGNVFCAITSKDSSTINGRFDYFGTADSRQIQKLIEGDINYSNWLSYRESNVQYVNTTTTWSEDIMLDRGVIVNGNLSIDDASIIFNNAMGQNFIQINHNFSISNSTIKSDLGNHTILYLNGTNGSIMDSTIMGQSGVGVHSEEGISISMSSLKQGYYSVVLTKGLNAAINGCEILKNHDGPVLRSSSHNTISNCNISLSDIQCITLEFSSNNTIQNCTMSSSSRDRRAISLTSSSNNSIVSCSVSSSYSAISEEGSLNNIIKNCYIFNNSYGIASFDSTNGKIVGCNISLSVHNSIEITYGCKNYTIKSCNISDSNIGVYCTDISSPFIENTTISNSSSYEFYISSNSHPITLNCSFNKENCYLYDSASNLTIKYFMHVKAVDNASAPMSGVTVRVNDTYENHVATSKTNGDGWVRWIKCTECVVDSATTTYYTPHNVTADDGIHINWTDAYMDESKEVIVQLDTLSYSIYLNRSWNLISIPLIQTDTNLTTVLRLIEGKYDIVRSYNATSLTDHWQTYRTSVPNGYNDLAYLNHKMGLWINITTADGVMFTVTGEKPSSTQIQLYKGWNLVNYPSFTDRNVSEALKGIPYEQVEGFDENAPPYYLRILSDSDIMTAGYGYWIRVTSDCIWTVYN
jgi:parallel beta-helix repeat protein